MRCFLPYSLGLRLVSAASGFDVGSGGCVRERVMPDGEGIRTELKLTVPNGLHLSPISQLVGCASEFSCSLSLSFDDKTADAKSVYDLMLLAAPCGAILELEANGADAPEAVVAIRQLFDGGFVIADHS